MERESVVTLVCCSYIMEVFSLQNFVILPSLEQINLCRKRDLLQIADHYQIAVSRQYLKKEIKSWVLQRLSELNVLPMSNVVASGNVSIGDVAVARLSSIIDEG